VPIGSVKVVDASALAAVLFGEPAAEAVAAEMGSALLAAPALIEYELGNICWKKCQRHPALADRLQVALALLPQLALRLHDVTPPAVLQLALLHRLSFYDASYAWLARELQAPLVTLDNRLLAALQ
jgi:predicted nucleic acid-binding protein